ncbi:hypothetical protein DFQ28_008559 [Apophysomyces sp. BC1034]|nr:hypothetical protein DFQ30_008256 [Apophysomyces sp. BC1015]KAG0175077.1 hypothetical protein DFQ29_007253 [Apophysomyces sp. BC1021]KAG0185925.1 hypothetical protein DFQ28_008559 [Apophysomyces sp. BC1034]
MRSLQLLNHCCAHVEGSSPKTRSFIANDPENLIVYVALQDESSVVRVLATDDSKAFIEIAQFPVETPINGTGAIVSFTYLSDLQVACLGMWNGDIILISKDRFEKGEEAMEIIGSVESGIHAMSWSPDQDLVVMITGERNVLEMTQDFDTITEFPLHVEEEGEGTQHSVGWGSKETQFHGSEGKQAALRKVDVAKFTISDDDDRMPRVAWRGDGRLFTCSDIDPLKEARVIRIYNREGVLQNTSEPVDRLEHVLDWRPSGNLIVSSQRLPHRHDIVFLEKNGLRHGEFTLRETTNHKLLEVSWNADSTVLAVWLEAEIPNSGKMQKSVQLWTSNNYHWYMKQHLVLAEDDDIVGFAWDVERPLWAHLVSGSGQYHQYIFSWETITSTSTAEENAGFVAVIDGASVLLTPFSYQNVPPPMCALTLKAENNVQHVSFGPGNAANRIAVLTNNKIQLFEIPENARGEAKLVGSILSPVLNVAQETYMRNPIRQLHWIKENKLVYVQYDGQASKDMICLADFSLDDEHTLNVDITPFDAHVHRVYHNASTNDLMVEDSMGSVYEVQIDNNDQVRINKVLQFPDNSCATIATARLNPQDAEEERLIVGLTERNRLYANDRLISSQCTSFFLRADWLVFTTTSHTARFIPLDISFEDFKLSDDVPDANDESCRRVERGAKIVLATQLKPTLVLQMPRGNLETISPRAFVLAAIREDIKHCNYRSAFVACRRNRIDLNILYDENPNQFISSIERFVQDIPEVDYLNLFLSNLRNEDTTVTMYRRRKRDQQAQDEQRLGNKVNYICEAARNVLLKLGRKRYIQSILSTYVRSSPPDLESALLLLAEIKETSLTDAEEALKYTIFLCDADRLYDVALGMYNFTLVLMVAQQAQKDPREYLPFLQELQKLEKYYQRFRIDDHLKRHEKALRDLSFAGDNHFDELIEYMQKHTLYLTALEEYANKPEQRQVILNVYGDYLVQTSAYEEAGIVFTMSGNFEKSLQAYRMAGSWREVFSLAKQMKYSNEDIHALAYDVIEYMKDKRRFHDAAIIANDYAQDIEESVDCLLKGSLWQEATRMSHMHDRSDLIETHVKPGLIDGYSQLDEDIIEIMSQFNKQTSRLKELRERKPEPTVVLPNDDTLDNIDMFSDTTSMYSQFTRYTQATSRVSTVSSKSSRNTSKRRKREDRKRARGKKGTVFEEEYLVSSLKRLFERVSNMQNDLGNILRALAPFGYVEEARAIQERFEKLLKDFELASPTIFVPLQLAISQFASPEEAEEANVPMQIDKPIMADIQWKLQIL